MCEGSYPYLPQIPTSRLTIFGVTWPMGKDEHNADMKWSIIMPISVQFGHKLSMSALFETK